MNKHGLIVILAMALLACSNAEERKTAYLEKAASLETQGNFDKARLELKNAQQIDPKDAQIWYRLGQIEEKLQNWRGAAGDYQQVLEMNAAHSGAKIKLARLFLLGGAPERAESLVQEVLKAEPDNADALVLRAGVAAQRKDPQSAESDARAALKKDPQNIDASIMMASLELRGGHPDEAVRLLTQAIGYHPQHAGLHMVLADVYAQQGRIDEGAAQLKDIIALDPMKAAPHMTLAKYYAQHKRPGDAERVLLAALQQQPKQQELQLSLVSFLVSQGRENDAARILEQYIKDAPEDYALRFHLAELHQAMGKGEQAEKDYDEIIAAADTKPDGLKARTQLARLLITQRKNDRASELLAQVLAKNPHDNDALILRSGLALQKQDAVSAIADLRAVLRDQPDSVPVLRQLASAHLLNGEPDLAVEALQRAAQAAPQDPAVHVALAELLAKQGQKAKAREQVDVVLKNAPENLGALDILYKLQMNDADYAEAAQAAQRIKSQRPGMGEYYLGLVSQAQKKNAEAIAHFEAALNKAPGAADALSALVKARLAQGRTAEAEQRLRKELARSSDNLAALNLLGEVLLLEKKTDAAIAALREAQRLDPSRATPYRNLAVAHMSKGEGEEAVAVLQKGISATGHDPELVFELASYEGNQGKSDQAIALYEEALKARPREPMFMNNLAMMLASYRQDKADINRAVELGERLKDKNNPAYLDTLGWAYYRRGDVAAAVSVLEAASRQAPDSALLSYHLGMVYYQKGDHAAARRYLEKAVTAKQPYLGADEAKATLAKLSTS